MLIGRRMNWYLRAVDLIQNSSENMDLRFVGSWSLRWKEKWWMLSSRRSAVNLSGLIDWQPNLTNATRQFNAVFSVFNIKVMNFLSASLVGLKRKWWATRATFNTHSRKEFQTLIGFGTGNKKRASFPARSSTGVVAQSSLAENFVSKRTTHQPKRFNINNLSLLSRQ